MRTRLAMLACAAALTGCGDDGGNGTGDEPGFPADYASSYVEVRDCRQSAGAHDINHVKVLADPAAAGPYMNRTDPFPAGAVVLKEEYTDADCTGPILQWSVMVKLADGEGDAAQLGWEWQRVVAIDNSVAEENAPRCSGCHSSCTGGAAGGYDYTCTDP